MKSNVSILPKGASTLNLALAALAGLFLSGLQMMAWETYHDPATQGQGYCAQCHSGFVGRGTLHDLHVAGDDPVTTTCNLCHTGSGRDNPLIMWSAGTTGTDGLGCTGCHGHDYGETIQANYRDFPVAGLHKNSARGLRRNHARVGVAICATCHADAEPYPENVISSGLGFTTHYYTRTSIVSLGGKAVDPCVNEDTANDADTIGLNNDGDGTALAGLYDVNDPDCNPNPLLLSVRSILTSTNLLISWPAPTPGYVLQENPNLNNRNNWSDKPAPTQHIMGSWQIVVPPSPQPRFYRLIKR